MKNLSNWRSVRLLQSQLERELRQRHSLGLHGVCIGFVTLGLMWGVSHLQMLLGFESLALRYLVTLGAGYLAYLAVLRWWAATLIGRGSAADGLDGAADAADLLFNGLSPVRSGADSAVRLPTLESGQGGDFGGGGATGSFGDRPDAAQGMGELAGGALEAVGGADEGAVVVIPVLAIFFLGALVFFSAGSLLLLLFGWEVLLTVAVELAFSYVSARAAVRVVREGWLSAAVRLTWKPLLGAIVCAVALGAAVDHFVPSANSLPQAFKLVRAQAH